MSADRIVRLERCAFLGHSWLLGLQAGALQRWYARQPGEPAPRSPFLPTLVHASHLQILRCAFKKKFSLEFWLSWSPGYVFIVDSVAQPSFKVKRCQGHSQSRCFCQLGQYLRTLVRSRSRLCDFAHIYCSGRSEGFEIEILLFILKHNY